MQECSPPAPGGETSELVCKHILKKIFTHLFSRGSRQSGVKIAGTSFQTGDVFGVIIGSTVGVRAAPRQDSGVGANAVAAKVTTRIRCDLKIRLVTSAATVSCIGPWPPGHRPKRLLDR